MAGINIWSGCGRGVASSSDIESGISCLRIAGIQAGRFDGDEVYGTGGHYLGEVRDEKRLITHRSKKHWRHSGFAPNPTRLVRSVL